MPASTLPRPTAPDGATAAANCTVVGPAPGLPGGAIGSTVLAQMARNCEELREQAQQRVQQQRLEADQQQRETAYRAKAARAALARQAREDAQKAALAAAETSPDNNCRKPDFAGGLIKAMNEMREKRGATTKVLDIEHLITVRWDAASLDVVCHGTFVLDDDQRLAGTLEMKPNVAGDMLTHWAAD